MILVHETQFCAPTSVYHAYTLADKIILEAHETYQKRSIRNKCIILGANGPQVLTIPLKKGKHNSKQIQEIEISYHDHWESQWLHTIRSAYGAAPYFEYYYPDIEKFIKSEQKYLWNLNIVLLQYIVKKIKLNVPLEESTEYQSAYPENHIDLRSHTIKDYQPIAQVEPTYAQVFEDRMGFIGNLSILDTLFCLGPETTLYLKQINSDILKPS